MKVYIKDGAELKNAIAEVFNDLGYNNLKNKKVFVKPNMLRIAKPEECVITDPRLLAATVSFLEESGAKIIVGDNPIPQKVNALDVADQCGFLEASAGSFRNIGRYVKKVKLSSKIVKEIYVSREILECDLLVSLPKFKTHQLTTFSSAIKNQFGIVPGGLKPYLHYLCPILNDFCRLLIDIYRIRPPDIIIVDCLNVRDARGKNFYPNKVIAGRDGYAVDYVCGLIAGIKSHKDPLLKLAIKEDLFDPGKIEIMGELEKLKGYALPISFPLRNFFAGLSAKLFSRYHIGFQPAIDTTVCKGCKACENICPKKAIKNKTVDYKRCIQCCCCIEVCPNSAIVRKFRI